VLWREGFELEVFEGWMFERELEAGWAQEYGLFCIGGNAARLEE